jgi:transposase-like protein
MRWVKYLDNIVKQDCRGVKQGIQPMSGFKSINAAQSALVGIELTHMLCKGQLTSGVEQELTAAEQFYKLAF